MNFKLICRIIAILLLILSAFMGTGVIVALVYHEHEVIRAFLLPMAVAAGVSALFLIISRKESTTLAARDGFLVVVLSWLSASVLGAFPLYLSGEVPTFADALFEIVSGFTTTGATILTDIEALPKALLFWRSLTHWLGGMGIIVLTVAILPILGIGGLQLIKAEAPGPTVDKITPKITDTAKILWMIYVTLSVSETVLLLIGGMNLFDALTHTFGTMPTGGFSPKSASIGHYDSAFIHVVVTVFMVLAGVNFLLYYKLLLGRGKTLTLDSEFRSYIAIFLGGTVVVGFALYGNGVYESIGETARYAGFQVAAILTTTGYVTTDFSLWPPFAKVALFVLMFTGGSSGSTAGGIKVVRIITLLKQAVTEMKYLLHPRGIFTTRLSGSAVGKNIVYSIAGFVFLYMVLVLLTALVVATGGYGIVTSLSTALATVGNIGPGFGLVGPAENYAFFPLWIKLYLSLVMITGRLEVFTVLVLFTPRFWRR
jgi:trk system potassium uptake protein TrkH